MNNENGQSRVDRSRNNHNVIYRPNNDERRRPGSLRRHSSLVSGALPPFETLLEEHVGAYGRWQQQITLLNIFLTVNAAAQTVSYPMITGQFEYQCIDSANNNRTLQRDAERCSYQAPDGENRPCSAWNFSSNYFGPAMVSEFALVCSRMWLGALFHTSFTLGCGIGVFSFGWLSDRLGRRYTLRLTIPLMIVANFALALAPEVWTVLAIRFVQGIVVFGNFTVIYVLSMETTLPRYRAFVGNLVHVPWGLNFMFTAAAAAWLPNWRWTQAVISLPSILCLIVYLPQFIPESPRWLLLRSGGGGDVERHRQQVYATLLHASKLNGKRNGLSSVEDDKLKQEILTRIRQLSSSRLDASANDHSARQEANEILLTNYSKTDKVSHADNQHGTLSGASKNDMQANQQNDDDNSATVLSLFRTPRMLRYTLLILVIWFQGAMANHGINFYIPKMAVNPFISYALVGVGETLAPLIGAFVFRIGRRVPIAITYALGALACVAMLPFVHWPISEFALLALGVISTLLSDMAFNGIYVHTSEIMPTVLRNTGLGLASASARVGSAGVSFVVAWKEQIWWLPPVVFAVGMFIGAICTLFLPSTDDCIMPETVQDVEDGFEKVKIGKKAKQAQLAAVD